MFNLRQSAAFAVAISVVFVMLSALFIGIPRSNGAATNALLWLDTSTPTVAIGDTFNVTVMITIPSPYAAAGVQFVVTWNSTIITEIAMMESLFHSVTPPSEWDNIWQIRAGFNNTGRIASYAVTFLNLARAESGGYAPITGTYVLAILEFKGNDTGRCLLNFSPSTVKVGAPGGISIPVAVPSGGLLISVGNLPPIISIVTPQNKGYSNTTSVNVTVAVNKPVSWLGYSIDDQSNVTLATGLNATRSSYLIPVSEGQHSLLLYGNDSIGQMTSSSKISFLADQTPPTTSLAVSPSTSGAAAELVLGNYRWEFTFNASGSHGHLSNITYFWDFGDGTNATGIAVTHDYREPGTYNATLKVTDLVGNIATQVNTITISPVSTLELPLGLITLILIPVIWIPLLAIYAVRTRKSSRKV